ncbi:MAG: hypothetical protein ACLRPC_01660 [Streptococcus sp.]
MSETVPRITGGILFGLMLEARKTKSRVRRGCLEERTDKLSETDIMKSFVDIFTGENQQMPYGNTFKKNVSDYKKCIISKTEYLPLMIRGSLIYLKILLNRIKRHTGKYV